MSSQPIDDNWQRVSINSANIALIGAHIATGINDNSKPLSMVFSKFFDNFGDGLGIGIVAVLGGA